LKGHYQLKRRPHAYPITEQQENFKDALQFCKIKKGISKAELQEKMRTCIPQYFKDLKEQEKASEIEDVAIESAKPEEQENVGEQEEEDNVLQPLGL